MDELINSKPHHPFKRYGHSSIFYQGKKNFFFFSNIFNKKKKGNLYITFGVFMDENKANYVNGIYFFIIFIFLTSKKKKKKNK